ncbi:acyltransferase [Novosphingobium sp.]|uniref:acyltransferase family protein n=1 Tax=Novosphingobium sp. TaxID=1874826 RepID=UPI00273645BA|nr:acyltransferase [Novosphingobium sp.]MDP3906995.1 acyltransferase [Novosphingobium sp.]
MPRLTLIDGLRGLAAVAVLFYHYMHFAMIGTDHERYFQYLDYQPARAMFGLLYDWGFYAVQLFWMISGFVFAAVYLDRPATTREFVVNRFARLYPLHFLTLLVVAGLQFIALQQVGHTLLYDNYDWWHFFLQLFFASDWLVGTGQSFNGPIWSVSVEVVVYALFWVLREPLRKFGAGGLIAVIALCLLGNLFSSVSRIPNCAFYFFVGTALFRLHEWLHLRNGAGRSLICAVLTLAGLAALREGSGLAREVVAIPALTGAALLMLAAVENAAPRGLRRASSWLGDCTYGIYLWHVPMQLALMLVILPHGNPAEFTAQGWVLAAWLGAVILAARLSFIWFERPLRERLRRHAEAGQI